jgi:alpha-beta hydrolase superfamily lysophospholipase
VDGVAAERPALPVFLAGISMGGLIVTNYASYRPEGLGGVIAVAPALGDTGGSRFLLALLPVLSRVVPSLPINPKLDLSRLTRDTELQRTYVSDPLYQTRVTPRIAAELLAAIADTRARAPGFHVPLLVLHGTADAFTPPAGSREFYERAGAGDKTYRLYEGAYHNLFVETNREEIYDDIAAWIEART